MSRRARTIRTHTTFRLDTSCSFMGYLSPQTMTPKRPWLEGGNACLEGTLRSSRVARFVAACRPSPVVDYATGVAAPWRRLRDACHGMRVLSVFRTRHHAWASRQRADPPHGIVDDASVARCGACHDVMDRLVHHAHAHPERSTIPHRVARPIVCHRNCPASQVQGARHLDVRRI